MYVCGFVLGRNTKGELCIVRRIKINHLAVVEMPLPAAAEVRAEEAGVAVAVLVVVMATQPHHNNSSNNNNNRSSQTTRKVSKKE